jgi:hypothetical protein
VASDYPADVDTFTPKTDGPDQFIYAADVNALQDAITATQTELGANPSGSAATVAARLAAIEAGGVGGGGGTGSTVTLDADGTLVVDGTTVEVATDAQLAAAVALLATKAATWVTGTTYVVDQLVVSAGTLYRCTTAHTAGGSFDGTKFAAVTGGGGAVSSVVGATGDVTGTQILADSTVAAALAAKASTASLTSGLAGKLDTTATAADSSKVGGVAVTGTPTAGMAPVATSGTAATWQDIATQAELAAVTAALPGTYGPLLTVRRVSASTTAAVGEVVAVDATTGSKTVTLSAAAVKSQSTVKKVDASGNAVLVVPDAGATIDGLSSVSILGQFDAVTFLRESSTSWVRV